MSENQTTPANKDGAASPLALAPGWAFGKLATFEAVSLSEANQMLVAWGHRMGPLARGDQRAWCHALTHEGNPVAVTTASYLIAPVVGNAHWLTRENTVELSRLCAARGGLCRVALRMWREFVLPALPFETAVSYQDADLHNGHTYRCDGWERVARSRSGVDTRSGRPGRDKWVWQYPPRASFDLNNAARAPREPSALDCKRPQRPGHAHLSSPNNPGQK